MLEPTAVALQASFIAVLYLCVAVVARRTVAVPAC